MFAALALFGMPLFAVAKKGWNSWGSSWVYIVFGVLVVAIILATWAGAVAAGKGRSMQWWFIIGFFIPVLGVIIIYILKPISTKDRKAKA